MFGIVNAYHDINLPLMKKFCVGLSTIYLIDNVIDIILIFHVIEYNFWQIFIVAHYDK